MRNPTSPQDCSDTDPPLPHFLYKYREVNPDKPFTRSMIIDGEFYFSSPDTFNDPFDCGTTFTIPADPEGRDQLLRYLAGFTDIDTATDIVRTMADPRVRQYFEQHDLPNVMRDLTRSIGLCCFSELKDSILMWSHYAMCHRGICVEIDTEKLTIDHHRMFAKVAYSPNYPTATMPLNQSDLWSIVYTKAQQWQYEREWRSRCKPPGIVRLGAEAIIGVILGCMISDVDETAIREWSAARQVPLKITKCVKSTVAYQLELPADK